ncbi:uncharacterized protein LOC132038161 [Lycium ferocissimum]|uniref:uncharacterized protein LOC132038161 n=1 Tax=Lycium ferocissimum TaxID=112874 RepID=UPI0028151854|nr:uncharacterized protein LOC132038161 [Lycium ferocissimum]
MMIKALIWNIRSINTQQAFQRLVMLQRQYKCFIIALMETFQNCRHLQKYKRRLGMESAIPNVNGKIWGFLDVVVQWEVLMDTEQQITLKLFHQDIGKEIIATFVYAKCDKVERLELWDNMYNLASTIELPWMVGGDFNVIISKDEKLGILPVTLVECEDFAFCVNSCGLFDIGFKGSPFTWWNGRAAEDCIFKRLDRVLANLPFQNNFPQIEVEHLSKTGSDDSPLILSCGEEAISFVKPFRFLNFWAKHESFKETVRQNWRTPFAVSPFLAFKQKLKNLKEVLSRWTRETYGDIFQQLAIGKKL